MLAALLATIAIPAAKPQDQPPIVPEIRPGKDGRGRDPWVFRLIFEDRTRMVAVALRPGLWYVFNPETCAPFKVWTGDMDFRGKVWDFSQDNSRAKGIVLAAAPSEIIALENGNLGHWEKHNTDWQNAWRFVGDGAALTSPSFDLSAWQRAFIAFDEQSKKGRIKVEVSNDGGQTWNAEHFSSATAVTNDTDWQWNFRLLETKSPNTRIRFVQEKGAHGKTVRNVRVFGDQPSWIDQNGDALKTHWRGYELLGQTKSVSLLYDLELPNGNIVNVRHRPESDIPGTWYEQISVRGLKPGDFVFFSPLEHESGIRTIYLPGTVRDDNSRWPFGLGQDGDVVIRYGAGR